ncbi:hypothetical protein PTI98_007374 [Pleurotus ostreatus]|nr:hypothetical protein PTI98_007374 [Pleurotus ostreatus]
MTADVDLVIPFRAFPNHTLSKKKTREGAKKAEKEYTRLIDTLTYSGLRAVGRRGESLGHILIFVACPEPLLKTLRNREGLTSALAPADRLRLVYEFVTSAPADGGLGITPETGEWDLVESVMLLHDKDFNDAWIRSWTRRTITTNQLIGIRDQFGGSTALYFAFLRTYASSLLLPAVLGVTFYFLDKPYHPAYAFALLLYSTVFTEYWRVYERLFTSRFYPKGRFQPSTSLASMSTSSFTREKVERTHNSGIAWWKRDLRILASFPIISVFAGLLALLLTAIFVFEAFVTQLYTGPGKKLIAFSPTILFVLLVPRFLAFYHRFATALTTWENHTTRSPAAISTNLYQNALATARAKQAHTASLTLKTFVLNALVAYLGIALSAFVYIPFGEEVMHAVQLWLSTVRVDTSFLGQIVEKLRLLGLNETFASPTPSKILASEAKYSIWETDVMGARKKLNPGRLRDQMFAFTVTNQVVNTFTEIGLPFILRFIGDKLASSKSSKSSIPSSASSSSASSAGSSIGSPLKKHVSFEDEQPPSELPPDEVQWEAELLEQARREVKLPEYDVFQDYSEMVVQFGYVVVWSSIWSLAPVMAFLNNILEQRSDAFKITVHARRPIPQRTQTIGPWLDSLTAIAWLGALVNAALVYMFGTGSILTDVDPLVQIDVDGAPPEYVSAPPPPYSPTNNFQEKKAVLLTALLFALAASHGYLLLRAVVRRIVERSMLGGRGIADFDDDQNLSNVAFADAKEVVEEAGEEKSVTEQGPVKMFWKRDDGLDEIARILKEA